MNQKDTNKQTLTVTLLIDDFIYIYIPDGKESEKCWDGVKVKQMFKKLWKRLKLQVLQMVSSI